MHVVSLSLSSRSLPLIAKLQYYVLHICLHISYSNIIYMFSEILYRLLCILEHGFNFLSTQIGMEK